MKNRPGKPNVFDYRKVDTYLADLIEWYKGKGISMRSLSSKLSVSVSLLSLICKGKRSMTEENVDLFADYFEWNSQEVSWIKQLILLNHPDVNTKYQAMDGLSRFQKFKDNSANEILTYKYLKKWWNVAIREMSELPDFQEDQEWIQKRLRFQVPLQEIRKSLNFLRKHKLLASQGEFRRLDCQANIYKLSLSAFHSQMLQRAVDSIYRVSSDDRYILGHTLALNSFHFPEAKKILDEALEKIARLNDDDATLDDVYHFSFLGFPLTSIKEKA